MGIDPDLLHESLYMRRIAALRSQALSLSLSPVARILEIRCGITSGKKACRKTLGTIERLIEDRTIAILRPSSEPAAVDMNGLPAPYGHEETIFPLVDDDLVHQVCLPPACKHGSWTFSMRELQARALDSTVSVYAPQRGVLTADDLFLYESDVQAMSAGDQDLVALLVSCWATGDWETDRLKTLSPQHRARIEAGAHALVREAEHRWRRQVHHRQHKSV